MSRTLRSQVQNLSVLPILGLTAVAILVSVVLTHQQVDVEASKDLQEVSRVLSSISGERSNSLASETRLLADSKAVLNALQSEDRAYLTDRAKSFVRNSRATAFLIVDDHDAVIAKAGTLSLAKIDPQLKALISATKQSDSTTRVISQGHRIYSAAASPVKNGDRTVGALVALSAIDSALAKDLKKTTGADVVFLSGKNVVGSSLPIKSLPKHFGDDPWRTNLLGQSFVALTTDLPHSDKSLEGTVVTLRQYDELAKPFRAFSTGFVVLLLAMLVIAAALARGFARGLARPMDELVKAAQSVRDGGWPSALEVERDDELGLLQSVFNDMTAALRKSQERLMGLVDTDPLTELENHRRFKERLDQEVFRACMSNKPLVLAMIDLDQFGEYNEQHGHTAGDDALRSFAALMNEVSPDIAFLARFGGEEFALLIPLGSLESVESLLERLKELCQNRFQSPLSFSAGIADITPGITTGPGLLLSAEMALSRAKQTGRDRICRFEAIPGAANADDPFQLQKFLQDSTLATIQTLAGAVDAKDSYTQGHSVRVARFASDLARYMNYPPAYVDLVYKTGTLHDVGKIGVPDSVLRKPARLDPEEQAIMETHTVLGELIVKKAPQLEEMLPGVRSHHERWDGRGYPDGLMGQQIPLLARFIAVADTFDAMTSDRPYRRSLPDDTALEEIKRMAGTQFDPEIAESFVRMMRLNNHGMRAA